MAANVGMGSILIEPDRLCHNLYRIPTLKNVLGGYTNGPELADTIATELKSTKLCHLELGRRATQLSTDDDHVTVTVTLANGGPERPMPSPSASVTHLLPRQATSSAIQLATAFPPPSTHASSSPATCAPPATSAS